MGVGQHHETTTAPCWEGKVDNIIVGCDGSGGNNSVSRSTITVNNAQLIAYTIDSGVALYDTVQNKVQHTLYPPRSELDLAVPTSTMKTVECINNEFIVAGDVSGTIHVWKLQHNNLFHSSALIRPITTNEDSSSPRRHHPSVTCLASYSSSSILLATYGDGSICAFDLKSTNPPLILYGNNDCEVAECLDVTQYYSSHQLLVAAGTISGKVCFYVVNISSWLLTRCKNMTLSHHNNGKWITALCFNNLLLATASQDEKIIIWKVVSGTNEIQKLQVLSNGHSDWVTSLSWKDSNDDDTLLSASMDSQVIQWKKITSKWEVQHRLGSVSSHGVGFRASRFVNKSVILALGHFKHQLYCWEEDDEKSWNQDLAVSGHSDAVTDISLGGGNNNDYYVLSCSKDQTVRMWAECNNNSNWVELSRPQIHGYDLNTIAAIPKHHRFISGGDEKVLRVFEAPKSVLSVLKANSKSVVEDFSAYKHAAAIVPELSLTTKATEESLINEKLPLPAELHCATCWVETQKLYGHGYDIINVSTSPSGRYVASSCKARSSSAAAVLIWDTTTIDSNNWQLLQSLEGHTSSVTTVEFSPCENWIVSGSKDRHVVFYKKSDESNLFEMKQRVSGHKRIIWALSWSSDSKSVISASRDKSVIIWKLNDGQWSAVDSITFVSAVTSVAFSTSTSSHLVVAIGLENGSLQVWEILQGNNCKCLLKIESSVKAIRKILWKSTCDLITCSDDSSIRFYSIIQV